MKLLLIQVPALVTGVACSTPNSPVEKPPARFSTPATHRGAVRVENTKSCRDELRERLHRRLRESGEYYRGEGDEPVTLAQLEQSAAGKQFGHELALSVLSLADPRQGLPLLRELVTSDHPYVAFDAAVVLALFDDRAGLALLKDPERYPLSSSNHAFGQGKAALYLLGEEIPASLRDQHSVFHDFEEERCFQTLHPPHR